MGFSSVLERYWGKCHDCLHKSILFFLYLKGNLKPGNSIWGNCMELAELLGLILKALPLVSRPLRCTFCLWVFSPSTKLWSMASPLMSRQQHACTAGSQNTQQPHIRHAEEHALRTHPSCIGATQRLWTNHSLLAAFSYQNRVKILSMDAVTGKGEGEGRRKTKFNWKAC